MTNLELQNLANSLFFYDGENLLWKIRQAKRLQIGDIAGGIHPDGHRYVSFNGKNIIPLLNSSIELYVISFIEAILVLCAIAILSLILNLLYSILSDLMIEFNCSQNKGLFFSLINFNNF